MKYSILFSLLTVFIYTGCSTKRPLPEIPKVTYEAPTEAKKIKFHPIMVKVAMSTRDNVNYNRMSLDTPEKKAWFKNLMYRLWDRQITRTQFVTEGLEKYPKHQYEFTFIANGFQRF